MNRKKQVPAPHHTRIVWGLILTLGIAGFGACSSSESSTVGRWGQWPPHSVNAGGAGNADGGILGKDGGSDAGSAYANHEIWMPHHNMKIQTGTEQVEELTGFTLTPEERSMVETCPRRPWSKNVHNRACTNHQECGDGFCDRGQCTAIYTCLQNLGSRCETNDHCPYLLCVQGRCSSCVSDKECAQKMGRLEYACRPTGLRSPGRTCGSRPWGDWRPSERELPCVYGPLDKKPSYCDDP